MKKSKITFERVEWVSITPVPVIGVDEAGRGCLAGPVVAGAVILKNSKSGLFADSKTLSAPRREELYEIITREHLWAAGFASVAEIDRLNIFKASLLAMRRAVQALRAEAGHVLVDGKFKIPNLKGYEQTALIKGDLRCEPVSAASIVAKVTRDRWMKRLHKEFPDYGFEIHKGYGTAHHREKLAALGPCAHHRRSFNGVEAREEL